jgi:hypothetical protein
MFYDTLTLFLISILILGVLFYFSQSKRTKYLIATIFFLEVFFLGVMLLASVPIVLSTVTTDVNAIGDNYRITETNNFSPLDLDNPFVNLFAWLCVGVGTIGTASCILKVGMPDVK